MIEFEKFKLKNGLTVIVHQDMSTPTVAMNILYQVGARDESPDKTGFAHLFEHLMFGGSVHIPSFDKPLESAGGENNAFTNSDITNYYITIPKENLETAFWLESDRMLQLAFSSKSLEVQRQVVIEEFKQSYLNQPYGDVWLLLKPLAYKVHPYQWNTIGKDISHIEDATMEDIYFFGLDKLVDTIVTVKGIFVPGAPSYSYAMNAFENADLIIAKGTGNFEALKGEINNKAIVYMLKVKCTPIAVNTGTNLGQFIMAVDN